MQSERALRVARKKPVPMGAGTGFYQIKMLRSAPSGFALRTCVAFFFASPDTLLASRSFAAMGTRGG